MNIFKNDAYNKILQKNVNDKIKKGHKVDEVFVTNNNPKPFRPKLTLVVDNTKKRK